MCKTTNITDLGKSVINTGASSKKESGLLSVVETMGISTDLILNNTEDPVLHISHDGLILGINPVATVSLGFHKDELLGKNLFDLIPDEYKSLILNRLNIDEEQRVNESSKKITEELFLLRFPDRRGKLKTYEAILVPYEEDSRKSCFLNLWKPQSGGKELASQLKEVQNNYEALTETITEAVIMIDESFKILYANSSCIKVFGYNKNELINSPFAMLFPEEVFVRYSGEFRKYFYIDSEENQTVKKEIELLGRNKNRGVSPIEISFGNSRELEKRTLICLIRDISQRKNVERKLRYIAYHDKLTELGNRDLFNTDIQNFFNLFKTHPGIRGALLFLDLDGFKQVNDTLGHQAGDKLLISTAKRLRNLMRESDMIYRFGGDEFVILITSLKQQSDAVVICNKILRAIQRPFNFDKKGQTHRVNIGVSIGVALLPEHGRDRETITRHADLAMYSSKEGGKNRYTIFSQDLTLSAQNKWIIDQGLKTALINQEMFLNYQPIVNRDGKIAGVEALIRWNHPEKGLIFPDDFIPSAEESGLINPLGQWVLEHALVDIEELNKSLDLDLFVSVNISTRQLKAADFPDILSMAIKRSAIHLKNLRLELTETFLLESPEMAISTLIKLKKDHPGLKIVIDDFGKGYSSLHYLSRLPVDCIKIDRSFIKEIPEDNNRKIINSIVNLATSMDMEMVAEGIETVEQQHYPPLENCQYFQGFLLGKPMSRKNLIQFIEG
ncbi:bifunctional diguanylate cyclase/phosphodiesterase [Oceanispirochaeta crateris]|uniref:Bifunctional diguanylate cyclase/phosphodiesterase n=1 Tax=Oceanispirochaeta crateris TaxID=2518645 RepID=A0A5C1QN06_9SPIO|nr:bifunctional diguanylate cyclase/phosphodiesterase [Oceanispirochaeta crateris]QEN08907.1 bifunctional diguanylate cyclase/phosphodiesterase [Oceanispirochaeta crateris]